MKTCADCIHIDVCTKESYATDINPYIDFSRRNDVDESCIDFKDKDKFIELPCPIGHVVYMIVNAYNDYDNVEYKAVIETSFKLDMLKSFNKKFFLTREEAEIKLRGDSISLEAKENTIQMLENRIGETCRVELSQHEWDELFAELRRVSGVELLYANPFLRHFGDYGITEPLRSRKHGTIGSRILYKGNNPFDSQKKIHIKKKIHIRKKQQKNKTNL